MLIGQLASILTLLIGSLCQETASGIYVVVDPPRRTVCDHELRMVVGKRKVCVSKKPIIPASELEYATDIRYDFQQKVNYIDVGVSSQALQTLNKMIDTLPQTYFALVVDDDVICLFNLNEEIGARYIRVGEDADVDGLRQISNILKKLTF